MANSFRGEGVALSRIFMQCEKDRPKFVTDFGCSLRSSDGEHSLIEVDWSGLAWKAGFRNHDVIEAVDATNFKMNGAGHCSVLEYLREAGRTCNMLVRRGTADDGGVQTYSWIGFRLKTKRGEPVVRKKVKRSVGTNIDDAERVHKSLPNWALQTSSPNFRFQYGNTQQIRLVSGQDTNNDRFLGFFVGSSASEPRFTTKDFVLNMHTYREVGDSISGTVAAFSAVPQQNQNMRNRHTGCFNGSASDDDDDERDDGQEACLSGGTSGPMMLPDFPSWMTNNERNILGNNRMFLWTLNNNQTGLLSTLSNSNSEKLYVSNKDDGAQLGTRKEWLAIVLVTSPSSSIYPNLEDY
nr:uncharacterized protein LOC129260728 [Lytechinus pictus]